MIVSCSSPERRAVDFLAREAPRWRAENGCFSCHNNGDASRALLAAGRAHPEHPEGEHAGAKAALYR